MQMHKYSYSSSNLRVALIILITDHSRTTTDWPKNFTVFPQVKKHQQAIVGFLEANRISFEEVDITMLEDQRFWMYRNIPEEKRPEKGNPLPPQIFNGDDYCGVSPPHMCHSFN